jgi:hypothetical protein
MHAVSLIHWIHRRPRNSLARNPQKTATRTRARHSRLARAVALTIIACNSALVGITGPGVIPLRKIQFKPNGWGDIGQATAARLFENRAQRTHDALNHLSRSTGLSELLGESIDGGGTNRHFSITDAISRH